MLQITINVVLQKVIPPHNIITLYAAYEPIIIVWPFEYQTDHQSKYQNQKTNFLLFFCVQSLPYQHNVKT